MGDSLERGGACVQRLSSHPLVPYPRGWRPLRETHELGTGYFSRPRSGAAQGDGALLGLVVTGLCGGLPMLTDNEGPPKAIKGLGGLPVKCRMPGAAADLKAPPLNAALSVQGDGRFRQACPPSASPQVSRAGGVYSLKNLSETI